MNASRVKGSPTGRARAHRVANPEGQPEAAPKRGKETVGRRRHGRLQRESREEVPRVPALLVEEEGLAVGREIREELPRRKQLACVSRVELPRMTPLARLFFSSFFFPPLFFFFSGPQYP